MNILEETKIAEDVCLYTTFEDQKIILEALSHSGEEILNSDAGIIIIRHNDDHCGSSWTEVQIIDKEEIYL